MSPRQPKGQLRARGYCRVSTQDQAEHGVSLEAQTERIQAWCHANGYELEEVHVDRGLSGGRADNRPALQEVLKRVGRGDSLVVYSLSRLARSVKDTLMIAELLDRKGANLVSLTEKIDTTSSSGLLVFRMLAVLGEFEKDVISERTSMAMRHLRKSGRYTGGITPFGFCNVDGTLQEDPKEMEVIQRIRQLRDAGETLRAIGKRLTDEGITSRAGKPFHAVQIHRILKAG